jgi:hypothetical protein
VETLPVLALIAVVAVAAVGFFWRLFARGQWERPDSLDDGRRRGGRE